VEALNRRAHKGASCWRQDDIFMAWLGETAQAREYVVQRAKGSNGASRFPTFWGPGNDWLPDQDHGGVLLTAVQSMLLQADGRKIISATCLAQGLGLRVLAPRALQHHGGGCDQGGQIGATEGHA